MALLSKVFRSCFALPLRGKLKQYNVNRDLDFSDDSDDGTKVYGTNTDPLAPPPPGMRLSYDPIPTEFFYKLANIERPRTAQPAYVSYVRGEQIWHIFNANCITLGRMASKAAQFLQGKHRPFFTHSSLQPEEKGDFIVVVNGKLPLLLGTKGKMKIYRSHSGYPGHLKELNIRQVLSKDWKRVVHQSIDGMLPKNKLRSGFLERVHIFPDIYHNFDFLPQLLVKPIPDPNETLQPKGIFTDPATKIVFASDLENIPEDIKGLKYEPQDLETPFHKMKEPKVPFNVNDIKKQKRHNRVLRRYKVFNHISQRFEIR